MNAYVFLQQALVAARQDALRGEADTTRLFSSARPLPAVSAGGRAAGSDRLASAARPVTAPRSLGEAAAADRRMTGRPAADHPPMSSSGPTAAKAAKASAGEQRLAAVDSGCSCAKGVAPAA